MLALARTSGHTQDVRAQAWSSSVPPKLAPRPSIRVVVLLTKAGPHTIQEGPYRAVMSATEACSDQLLHCWHAAPYSCLLAATMQASQVLDGLCVGGHQSL